MRRIVTIIFLALFLFPAFGFAEEYVFGKGTGVGVCEEFYKNIRRFHPRDIACYMQFDSDFKDFEAIEWEEWDLNEHKDLAIKIKKFLTFGDQFAKIADLDDERLFVPDLKNNPDFITDAMYFARIDIFNEGVPQNVIRYSEGHCMRTRPFAKFLLVLNRDNNLIDVKKTDPLMQNPSADKSLRGRIAAGIYNIYDAFTYKRRTYISHYVGIGNFCNEPLIIYELSGQKAKQICRYKTVIWCK